MAKNILLKIIRKEDTVFVTVLKHKETGLYSFVNLTKGHICPCTFKTIEDALKDLQNYSNIISWEVLNEYLI